MSGFKIKVSKLMEMAGWTMKGVTHEMDQDKVSMGTHCGLILSG